MTLTEKYNKVLAGRFAKAQFLRDARLAHPTLVTQHNSYDNAVNILRNRGMIFEMEDSTLDIEVQADKFEDEKEVTRLANQVPKKGKRIVRKNGLTRGKRELKEEAGTLEKYKATKTQKVQKTLTQEQFLDTVSLEEVQRGLDIELEAAGFDSVAANPVSFTVEDKKKALAKTVKNLQKDRNYYLNQIAKHPGGKRTDQYTEANKNNTVDKDNGMKKAQLREAVQGIIKKVLTERADKLEKFLETDDPEVTQGVEELTTIILELEKSCLSHKSKIEAAYEKIGPYMAPAISQAFMQDVNDVVYKYGNTRLPKTPTLSPDQERSIRHAQKKIS